MITKLLSRNIDSQIEVSNKEIKSYFTDNKEAFKNPELIKIEEVFLLVKPGSSTSEWEEAQIKMDELYLTIKDSSDFLMAAKGLSKDVSVGRSDFLRRGSLPPEVSNIAFNIPVGQMSKVIKSSIGFHVVRLVDKKAPKQRKLSEVNAYIREAIFRKKAREKYEEWIENLRLKSVIDKKAK